MKKFQSVGVPLSAIMGLLVILLVSVFAGSARDAYNLRSADKNLLSQVETLRHVYAAREAFNRERGAMAGASWRAANASDRARIASEHKAAENALAVVIADADRESGAGSFVAGINRATAHYQASYDKALRLIAEPRRQLAGLPADYTISVNALMAAIDVRTRQRSVDIAGVDSFNNEMMKVNRIVWTARQAIGQDRRLVVDAIAAREKLTSQQLQRFAELDGSIKSPWAALRNDQTNLTNFPPALAETLGAATNAYYVRVRGRRSQILSDMAQGKASPVPLRAWMTLSDIGLNAVTAVSKTTFDLTHRDVARRLAAASGRFETAVALMLLSIGLAASALLYVGFQVIRPLRCITGAMENVAAGRMECAIPFQDRPDEIGQFARALCQFRDDSLEKDRLEEELRRNMVAKQTAEASSRVKSQFLANMSHELRTPLNAIIGFSDLIKNQVFGPVHKRYEEYAGIIHESGNHLLNLVSDILDIAKIEAGKFVLNFQDVALEESVNYCVRLVKVRADQNRIAIVVNLPATPVVFSADQRAFRQIMLNLLSNAVKYSHKGGCITLNADVVDSSLRIVVHDSGIGMSASLLARIGQPFEQAFNDPARAREGTGLGLSLVRALVAQHGGSLHIESREGAGTSVALELPLFQAALAAA